MEHGVSRRFGAGEKGESKAFMTFFESLFLKIFVVNTGALFLNGLNGKGI